jgi:hypothetical protein
MKHYLAWVRQTVPVLFQWGKSLPNIVRTTPVCRMINEAATVSDTHRRAVRSAAAKHPPIESARPQLDERALATLEAVRAEAREKAGEPHDVVQRARHLIQLWRDSGGNHTFPLIALVTPWGHNFVKFSTGTLSVWFRAKEFFGDAGGPKQKQTLVPAHTRTTTLN